MENSMSLCIIEDSDCGEFHVAFESEGDETSRLKASNDLVSPDTSILTHKIYTKPYPTKHRRKQALQSSINCESIECRNWCKSYWLNPFTFWRIIGLIITITVVYWAVKTAIKSHTRVTKYNSLNSKGSCNLYKRDRHKDGDYTFYWTIHDFPVCGDYPSWTTEGDEDDYDCCNLNYDCYADEHCSIVLIERDKLKTYIAAVIYAIGGALIFMCSCCSCFVSFCYFVDESFPCGWRKGTIIDCTEAKQYISGKNKRIYAQNQWNRLQSHQKVDYYISYQGKTLEINEILPAIDMNTIFIIYELFNQLDLETNMLSVSVEEYDQKHIDIGDQHKNKNIVNTLKCCWGTIVIILPVIFQIAFSCFMIAIDLYSDIKLGNTYLEDTIKCEDCYDEPEMNLKVHGVLLYIFGIIGCLIEICCLFIECFVESDIPYLRMTRLIGDFGCMCVDLNVIDLFGHDFVTPQWERAFWISVAMWIYEGCCFKGISGNEDLKQQADTARGATCCILIAFVIAAIVLTSNLNF